MEIETVNCRNENIDYKLVNVKMLNSEFD